MGPEDAPTAFSPGDVSDGVMDAPPVAASRARAGGSARRGFSAINVLGVMIGLALVVTLLDALIPGLPARGDGPVGAWMALVSGICPQRPAHSYTLGGVQLPIEARMMGIFAGFFFGAAELATVGRHRSHRWPSRPVAAALLIGFAAMAFDGTNALFYDLGLPHAYAPDLRLRLATGSLAGLAMAFALVPALSEVLEPLGAFGAGADERRPEWRDVGLAVAAAAIYGVLMASGWVPLLYPVSLVAVAGVVLAFLLIFLTIIVSVRTSGSTAPTDGVRRAAMWRMYALAVALGVGALAVLALVRTVLPVV